MTCDVGGNCAAPFSICTAAGRAEACEQQHSGRVGYFNKSAAAYLGQSQSGAEECPALEACRAKQLAPLRIPFLLPPTRRVVPHREWTILLLLSVREEENHVWHVPTDCDWWRSSAAVIRNTWSTDWCCILAAIDCTGYWISGIPFFRLGIFYQCCLTAVIVIIFIIL